MPEARGMPARLHHAGPHHLDDAGLIDVTRVVLDTAPVRAKKGGSNTQARAPWTGTTRLPGCVLSDANGPPLLVGVPAGNTHDSKGLSPWPRATKRNTTPTADGTSRHNGCTRTRPTTFPTCGDGGGASTSACPWPAKESRPANEESTPEMGDRAHDVVAVPLPQTQPPLRARPPQLPGLSRTCRRTKSRGSRRR
ncbi:conserved hypothetical protein [Streptomyces sviceus ATCC 29083]|uniref:Transposase n=1 Tax=Streptomyces sviceus (strain ATCC 29083 / DSM 924 / JCM 4929 / NBRC 13980 / NCIMB 11184 / NRRL 5439 / UC 5370) TaxID=463191 RepID=B5HUX5_STRX2|nr:conserved hypothetical protein [Streptomyces sviceus ATCC 29083]